MQQPLYFAYGSNVYLDRIQQRLGKVIRVSTLTIPGYELAFDSHGVGYMKPEEKGEIEGVLYRLTPEQTSTLDFYENVPRTYQKWYDTLENGVLYYFYNREETKEPSLPLLYYLNYIIDGMIQNGLKKTANKLILFKEKNYKLKKGSKHKMLDIL